MFEINLLFWAPLGCIHFETREFFTCAKNVRPVADMCAPGAECTVNFEHFEILKFCCRAVGRPHPLVGPKLEWEYIENVPPMAPSNCAFSKLFPSTGKIPASLQENITGLP